MNTAQRARKMGLKVGDTIKGRAARPDGSGWHEARLTLLWIGKTECMWRVRTRTSEMPHWGHAEESSDWLLEYRKWVKIKSTGF